PRPASSSTRPAASIESASLEVQTEAGQVASGDRPGSARPFSARPGSAARAPFAATPSSPPADEAPSTSQPDPDPASSPPAAAAPASVPPPDPSDPLSILDRLEALERQRQAEAEVEEGDDGGGGFTVTTATGLVLTKNTRLPDEVLMPPNEGCALSGTSAVGAASVQLPTPASVQHPFLSAEAASMENKLADLKRAMEKERAKREALMANVGGGSIWRNGRTNIKGKGPGDAASGSTTSTTRRPGSNEPSSSAGGFPGQPSLPASARATPEPGARPGPEAGTAAMPLVSGSRLSAPRESPPQAAGAGSRKADVLDLQVCRDGGGMSCGTDDGPALGAGGFSEADSHRSFLDALNEWRKGSRGEDAGEAAAAPAAAPAAGARPASSSTRPAASIESASLEVQTEVRQPVRPTSAKPLSYFDKLVINTTSRQAGQVASGGEGAGPVHTRRAAAAACGRQVGGLREAAARDSVGPGPKVVTDRPGSARPFSARPASAARAPHAATPSSPPADEAPSTSPPDADPASAPPDASASASASASAPPPDPSDPLSILDRLEALERQRQAAAEVDEGDDGGGGFTVTTATGLVLTKNTRLPDEVLMPPNEGC
ncbi:hypothetical protein TSOC_005527, partial [Tetrabaena socialis]